MKYTQNFKVTEYFLMSNKLYDYMDKSDRSPFKSIVTIYKYTILLYKY